MAKICNKNDLEPSVGSVAFPPALADTAATASVYLHLKSAHLDQESRKEEIHNVLGSTLRSIFLMTLNIACFIYVLEKCDLSCGIKSFPAENIQKPVQGLCQRGHCGNVCLALFSAVHIYGNLSVNTVEDTVMHKNKERFFFKELMVYWGRHTSLRCDYSCLCSELCFCIRERSRMISKMCKRVDLPRPLRQMSTKLQKCFISLSSKLLAYPSAFHILIDSTRPGIFL